MSKNLSEILYLTRTLELLMIKDGASGVSFSDKVKSYDKGYFGPDLSHFGSDFFYLHGTYYRKGTDPNNYHYWEEGQKDEELEKYRRFKNYKAYLVDENYDTLIKIGHERNQVMHIDDYTISNYQRFKESAVRIIEYFKTKKIYY